MHNLPCGTYFHVSLFLLGVLVLVLCCNFLSAGLWLRCAIIIRILCLIRSKFSLHCLLGRSKTLCVLLASIHLDFPLLGVLLEVSHSSQLFRLFK